MANEEMSRKESVGCCIQTERGKILQKLSYSLNGENSYMDCMVVFIVF